MPLAPFPRILLDQGKKFYEHQIGLAPRTDGEYATHVPILVGVAAALRPKLFLEFGSGIFSTLSLLDEEAFPSIEKVESYENNREWFEQIRDRVGLASRVSLQYVDGDMHLSVEGINTSRADMIFVDDSPSGEERARTVRGVARRCGLGPVVVIHDCELWRLRLASRRFANHVYFDAFNPQTCVAWNGRPELAPILETVNETIRQHAGDVELTDIHGWARIFYK
jgi:hypothetical protein